MNNCKKCGSDNIKQRTINQVGNKRYQIACMNCGNETESFLQPQTAKNEWSNQNKPEYKTIPEFRVMFESHNIYIYHRNPGGDYMLGPVKTAWDSYLRCAQDLGYLPDIDLLRERVK